MIIIITLILLLFLLLLIITIYKKSSSISFKKIHHFLNQNIMNFLILTVSVIGLAKLINKIKSSSILALDEEKIKATKERFRVERIKQLKEQAKTKSQYFCNDNHDFSLKKTRVLNVLLDYKISLLSDIDLQYIYMNRAKDFFQNFDNEILHMLSDNGEFGKALQQCSLLIEDIFKEMSQTPGLVRRKMEQRQQIKFQEGEVLERKLVDEVFDNYAKFITDDTHNAAIFEECIKIVNGFIIAKYSNKRLSIDTYLFQLDPMFQKMAKEVIRKYLKEHVEFK